MKNHNTRSHNIQSMFNRKIALLLLLFVFSTVSFAQNFKTEQFNKRILSFNPGISFSGSGDSFGLGAEFSYLKTLLPWVYHRETFSSWIVNGESWIDGGYQNQTGMDFAIELGITPFFSANRSLGLSFGVCVGNIMSIRTGSGGSQYNTNGSYFRYHNNAYDNVWDTGFVLGANYHYFMTSKLSLNLRAAFRGYSKTGSAVSILSAGIGYRIN